VDAGLRTSHGAVGAPPVPLSETVRSPGCSSKISKRDLHAVLAGLPDVADPRVLVGRAAGDDAGVIRLDSGDGPATVLTVDVFSPSVDDPYTFGQIAAANSVSDIYAMGAEPQVALSVIGFPIHTLPRETMHEILRGGLEKMAEAGISVIGGHSINDEEVKCGFAVVGHVPVDGFLANAGARVGDAVVLTKPLGVAIVAFAHQIGRADPAACEAIARSMTALNRTAGSRMREYGAHAATDVTGFSLLGHMAEIAKNSQVRLEIDLESVPVFPGVKDLACADVIPGGVERNRESVPPDLLDLAALTPAQQAVLFCPETSGGLLVFLPPDRARAFVEMLRANDAPAAVVIGRVTAEQPGGCIALKTQAASSWTTCPRPAAPARPASPAAAASCCAAPPAAPAASCCAGGPAAGEPSAQADAPAQGTPGFLVPPAAGEAFKAYMAAANQPGALDAKAKKLISLALSVLAKCGPCIKIQTKAAKDAGATDGEIAEAVALGISFGGAPVNMFYQELLDG